LAGKLPKFLDSVNRLDAALFTNSTSHRDPVYIDDVFCRVGGPKNYNSTAKSCMTVNSNDVIIDDTWLWPI